jgi:sporulation protein YlmC with PRC-barrel domain
MRTILLASAAVIALSPIAYAQDVNSTQPPTTANQTVSKQHLGADLRNMLQKSGYTDIRVAPTSFMVRAKDSDGNPVVMSISPDSFTELTGVANTNGTTTGAATASKKDGSDRFVTISGNDELSSKLIGLDVYNDKNQDIGQIKDIALNQGGQAEAYVLSVGGMLGMGEHYVAVNPSQVKITYNDSDKKWHASMNATTDQLKAAPEFKYSGHWSASKG